MYGLSKLLPPDRLTLIGNVADDFELYGLHISPDLDTVMYTLAGIANPVTGWGITGDTWQMIDMLARYGEDVWFRLGDRDLATHLRRTQWLAQGVSLTDVTARLMQALGVEHRLLPVTDDSLITKVETVEHGSLGFQEYFVRHRWKPTVKRVWFQGAEQARLTQAVDAALTQADVIVFSPSNPVLSIAPILAVPGVRDRIADRLCVAVSPFVGGRAVKGPADKLMGEMGLDITPDGLIRYYAGLLDGLMIDVADRGQPVSGETVVLATPTLMTSDEDKVRLAEELLDWVGRLI
ncbi:MAG: 2-phospho-L-lactate transferase [Anaerolineae bacterium]|nr:2-phospho-L-lactate transferase [Anaerolineae bacterium]